MNQLKSAPQHWVPATDRERARVLQELEAVIASPQFCNSKRYPALLRYVVEMTLAGKGDQLKERTLGVEVFHRPPDYDTNTETVVRYTAGEVRKRLAVYYHERTASNLQIALPTGNYVAEFLLFEAEEAVPVLPDKVPTKNSAALVPMVPEDSGGQEQTRYGLAPQVQVAAGQGRASRLAYSIVAACLLVVALAAGWWRAGHRTRALDAFWTPMLREHGDTVICSGGVIFADGSFSGTHTAGKNTEYPFASMQIVSGVSRISGQLERGGATYGVEASSSTQLSQLREHPVVLIGGYNNEWTMRLLNPLRFHFTPTPDAAIVDSEQPGARWYRDHNQPYSSADDYAIVARFRDTVTGSMVVVAAGLGRNGTELASQFVTSERYMEQLQQRLGGRLGMGNVEVLLQSRVIYGKTGAPQILAVHTW